MIYERFDTTGDQHSLLGFGVMRMPTSEDGSIDTERASAMMRLALDSGVNYFDTAYVYHGGNSETFFRDCFADQPRDSYLLADKLPIWILEQPEDMERIFSEQLERCGVRYFDYYLAHSMSRGNIDRMQRLGTLEFLKRKREQGYIRHLGFSFHDDEAVLAELCDMCDWDFCQLQLNYADWNRFGASKLYAVAEAKHLPIIVMEPVRGGFLANPPPAAAALLRAANPDRSYASWALRYVASLPQVKLVLSGMSDIEQVTDNLQTFCDRGVYLTDDEQLLMQQVITELDKAQTIPCTGCRYCMPCPHGVDIPSVFQSYNNAKFICAGDGGYDKLPTDKRADSCVGCKACEAHCPQHMLISELLATAHSELVIPISD